MYFVKLLIRLNDKGFFILWAFSIKYSGRGITNIILDFFKIRHRDRSATLINDWFRFLERFHLVPLENIRTVSSGPFN